MNGNFMQSSTISNLIYDPNNGMNGVINPSDKPQWTNNQKKRIIPNHLILKKKTDFLKNNDNKVDFNSISFGNKNQSLLKKEQSSNNSNSAQDTFNYDTIMSNDDDLPPMKSIYDLNDDDENVLNNEEILNNSFINKDPKQYNNIFRSGDINTNNNNNTTSEVTINNTIINPIHNAESAVLIFGYPESMANQVLAHFSNFGTILEDFDVIRKKNNASFYQSSSVQTNQSANIPIFSGNSWIKVTYDNPSSAVRALEENGCFFNGSLLGVVPYNKTSIEKLQKRKLNDDEDIGNSFIYQNQSFNMNHTFNLNQENQPQKLDQLDKNAAFTSSILELKDGKSLFLDPETNKPMKDKENKPTDENKKKDLSLAGKINNYLFGFNEL